MVCGPITAHNEAQTADATPQNLVLFQGNPNSSINCRLLIIARRPSDGATKCWDLTAVMKCDGAGVASLLTTVGATPFGAAGDLTALTNATIAFFQSGGNIGLTITGIAATALSWCVDLLGSQLID